MRDDLAVEGTRVPERPAHLQPRLLLLVLAGGAVGTLLRYALATALAARGPLATLLANVSGALLLGALLEGLARRGPDTGGRRAARLALGSGVLGAYTTYSTLAVEAVLLARDGRPLAGLAYGVGSALAGLLAAALGIGLAARVGSRG